MSTPPHARPEPAPGAPERLAATVRTALAAAGDPDRAAAQQRYMRSAMPFRGVGLPAVRAVVREALRAHRPAGADEWQRSIRLLWDGAAYREERYAAVAVARAFPALAADPAAMDLYRHLVVTGAWWDHVDEVAAHLVGAVLRAHPEQAARISRWAREEDVWLRRTAILAQLGSKERTDRGLLLGCIEANLAETDVFIRKAIGWALRQYARVDPAFVRDAVASYGMRLSPLSRREALRGT